MKKIMFLLNASAVLTTFAALANAQVHEAIIPAERTINIQQPAIQNLQEPAIQNLQEPAIQNLQQPAAISHQPAIPQQPTISEQSTTSGSVTIQATPTPDEEAPHTHGHHHPEETPTPPLLMTFGAGEKYPQTRTKQIPEEEAAAMSYAQLRYAINEIYARHGFDFPKQAIANQFRKFEWYHPRRGVLMTEIDNEFSETERTNVLVLAKYKKQKWANGER